MTRAELDGFLAANHQAVMVTLRTDGSPHAVPVFCGLVDGALWVSGTEERIRTKHVRRDPRCALTVFEPGTWFRWVTVEGRCEVRTGDAVEENLRLYRLITGKDPDDMVEYRAAMVAEGRLIYAVSIDRWYP